MSTPTQQSALRSRALRPLFGAIITIGVVYACWFFHTLAAPSGWPYPYSDEAAHVAKTVDLVQALSHSDGYWNRLSTWLFSMDAYPNAVYATAIGLQATTLPALRAAMAPFMMVHLGIALFFGSRLWGGWGAIAYAALVGFTAYPLAFAQGYYLDVPLMSSVGAAVILLEASDGFRKALPSILFVLVAAVGLYTKWTWALFCAIPCILAVARSLGPLGWRGRIGGALALIALVAGGGWLVWQAGQTVQPMGAANARTFQAAALVIGGLRILAGWGVVALALAMGKILKKRADRSWLPLVQAGLALGLVATLAGPWYALVWQQLWGRYTHEQGAFETRINPPLADIVRVFYDLLPAGAVLVPLGLLAAFGWRAGRLHGLARLAGLGLSAWLTLTYLPQDTRYLYPLLPLGAGVVVAGGRAWHPLYGWGVATVALGLAWVTGIAPLLHQSTYTATVPAIHGVPVGRFGLPPGYRLPILIEIIPDVPADVLPRVVTSLQQACQGHSPCRTHWNPPPASTLSNRGIVAFARLEGVEVEAVEPDCTHADVCGFIRCSHSTGCTVTVSPP